MKTQRSKLRRQPPLSLAALDALLNVEPSAFDRELGAVVNGGHVELDVPREEGLIGANPNVAWPSLYRRQIQRLPRMTRDQEFSMARRYEFFKARLGAVLCGVGYPEAEVAGLMKNGRANLPPPPTATTAEQRASLEAAFGDLDTVRCGYVEGGLYLVLSCAYRYRNLGVDLPDLIQEGNHSLFQAVDGFDWRRGVRFKTYAQYWIQQAILKSLYNCSRTVRVPVWVQKALSKINKVRDRRRSTEGVLPADDVVGQELGLPSGRVRELLETKRFSTSLDAELVGEDGASLGQVLADRRSLAPAELIEDGDLGACLDRAMAVLPLREQDILARRYGLRGQSPETLGEIGADLGITAERVRQLQKSALVRMQRPSVLNRLRAYE